MVGETRGWGRRSWRLGLIVAWAGIMAVAFVVPVNRLAGAAPPAASGQLEGGKGAALYYYASLAELNAGGHVGPLAEVGFTDAIVHVDSGFFWDPVTATTQAEIDAAAAEIAALTPDVRVHVAFWCFGLAEGYPYRNLNPWFADAPQWADFVVRLKYWSAACKARGFAGVAMDAEHYPSTPNMSGGYMNRNLAWVDTPGMAARGAEYAAALRSEKPDLILSNYVTYRTVAVASLVNGDEPVPLAGYYTFWRAVYGAAGGGLMLYEDPYTRGIDDFPQMRKTIQDELGATSVPGLSFTSASVADPKFETTVRQAFHGSGHGAWFYNWGQQPLADPATVASASEVFWKVR